MIIFTTRTNLEVAELLSAPCPDCPEFSKYPKGSDMSVLSQEERGHVDSHPFGNSLSWCRASLSTALQPQDGPNSQPFVLSILALLTSLWVSPVSALLQSRISRGTLKDDLTVILENHDNLAYKYSGRLAGSVIMNESDIDIWSATTSFVQAIAQIALAPPTVPPPVPPPASPLASPSASLLGTPSTSPAPEIEGTPIHRTSNSHLPYEDDADEVERLLDEEIRSHTKQADEFYGKHFENKAWHSGANEMWEGAKRLHSGGRWSTLQDPPTQKRMYAFLFDLQDKFLSRNKRVRGTYGKGSLKDMFKQSGKNKPDMFTFTTVEHVPGAQHHWKDIAVVGELKESEYPGENSFLQVTRYARAVFAHQPTRNFVHAFTIVGTEMLTFIFDRSGVYTGEKFDIHDNPEAFCQIFCGYVMMDDAELGFNRFVSTAGGKLSIQIKDRTSKTLNLDLHHPPISYQRAIVCRGTACYRASVRGADVNGGDNSDCVVKFSWSSRTRTPESEFLEEASRCGVKGVPEVLASLQLTSTSELREGLNFHDLPIVEEGRQQGDSQRGSKRRKLDNQQAVDPGPVEEPASSDYPCIPFKDRVLRVLVISPAGRAIDDFKTPSELLGGLRDAIRGHQSLYEDARILHRDVSEDNIILTSPQGPDDLKGLLIDLDMAQKKGTRSSRDSERTCSVEFMAIEALGGKQHTYRHDLESFLYVLLWLFARRGWVARRAFKKDAESSLAHGWVEKTHWNKAVYKLGLMHPVGFEKFLTEFHTAYECVKPLCRELRDILFKTESSEMFTGTPASSRLIYEQFIKAFDDALQSTDPEHHVATTTQPTRGRGRQSGGSTRGGRGGRTRGGRGRR